MSWSLTSWENLSRQVDLKFTGGYLEGHENILLHSGDLSLKSDMDFDWVCTLERDIPGLEASELRLIVINGNLSVQGLVRPCNDYSPNLAVSGNVDADAIHSSGEIIIVKGNTDLRFGLYGSYSDGHIQLQGSTRTPYVFNYNHSIVIDCVDAIYFNVYDNSNDFFDYDYYEHQLKEVLIKEAYDRQFDFLNFLKLLQNGQIPFKVTPKKKT